ncbi:hypothetical protein EN45_075380 [Penicillium chrysogenum]|uniref:Uncharacterized protein n=1 Tax=Penicillium chrysogenum TaxID=5076 RepID=A0A167U5N1_PENCH|nr:hypothetical protein EN45_075380 [Penicillium chrysogenum]
MMNYGGHQFHPQQPQQPQQQQHQGVQPQHPLGPQPQRQHAQSPLLGAGPPLPQHGSPFPGNKPIFRGQPQQNFAATQSPDMRKMTPTSGSLGGYPTSSSFGQFPGQFAAQSSPDLMSRNQTLWGCRISSVGLIPSPTSGRSRGQRASLMDIP